MSINRNRLLETFLEMCRMNTPARKEGPLADWLEANLEQIGLQCVRDGAAGPTGSDTGNLIATLQANAPGAQAMFFAAHMDTVEPSAGVQIVIDGDTIRTDGSTILGADDRAGIAPIVEALRSLVESGARHGTVQAVFTVCEEVGLLGGKHLDRSLVQASFGFVLDSGPPPGSIVCAAPSQDSLDVVITGRPAHAGAEPEKGISAIQVAARAIDRMRLGRIDAETTANVGVIEGGQATNIVCPEVLLRAEARSRDADKLRAQVEHMTTTFREVAEQFGASVDIAIDHQYDAYRLTEADPLVALALRAGRAAGLAPMLKEAGGGSDANVFNAKGLPTCVLGTAMSGVHTHAEHASVDELCMSAEWVLELMRAGVGSR